MEEVDELIELLGNSDLVARCAAVDALGKTGDARAVAPLIGLLGDRDLGFRVSCALGKIGKVAVEPLLEVIRDEDCAFRCGAVDALGEIGDTRATEPLIKLLGDKDWALRSDAAAALTKIGRPAVEPLIELLGNGDITVRTRAANILGRIGDTRALEPLILALWDREKTASLCASDALDKIDCNWTAREPARKMLSYLSEALMKGSIPVKFCIIDVLERIGDPGVSGILTRALEFEEKNLQARVAEALENVRNRCTGRP